MKFVKRLSKVKTVVVKKLSSIKISSYKIYTKTKNRQEEKLKNFFKIIEAMFCTAARRDDCDCASSYSGARSATNPTLTQTQSMH